MKSFLPLGLVLVGLGAILFVLAFVGVSAPSLPYATLQDIPDTDIVARGTVSCGGQVVIALALHHPSRGYFMLWMTATGWVLAPFGLEEPAPGTLATRVYWGRWEQRADQSWFVLRGTDGVPSDPSRRMAQFCGRLFPEEA